MLAKLRELGYDEVVKEYAGVVKLADTLDSKSSEAYPSCGFKSLLRHQVRCSSLVARISQTKYKILPMTKEGDLKPSIK